jgi:predicted metal-binding protein
MSREICIYYASFRKRLTSGEKKVIKKIAVAAASAMLVATIFAASPRPVYAATKVDCDAVMNEVNSGKHAKEVAKDLSISTSSVYRCKRQAKAAAKAGTKSMTAGGKVEPPAAPMASSAASPAAAASAAAKK